MKYIILIIMLLSLTAVFAQSGSLRYANFSDVLNWGVVLNEKLETGHTALLLISSEDSLFVAVVKRYNPKTGQELTPDSLFFSFRDMLHTKALAQSRLSETDEMLDLMRGKLK